MQVLSDVYLVGSGSHMGMGLTQKHDCNVYLLKGQTGDLLIDSGLGIKPELIDDKLLAAGSGPRLKYVLHTHAHKDHCGGACYFRRKYGCQVGLSELTAHLLEEGTEEAVGMAEAKARGDYDPDYTFTGCEVDLKLKDGDEFDLGNKTLKCISFQGHSPGSTLFLVRGAEGCYLFSGDSLFSGGQIGLLNKPGSSLDAYRENIGKTHGIGVDALFPGHLHFCLTHAQDILDKIAETLQKDVKLPPNFI